MTSSSHTGPVYSVSAIHRKRRDVYEISLDNGRTFLCPDDVLVRWHLRKGKKLDESQLGRLLVEAEEVLAVRRALAIVARAPRSEQEVALRLHRRGFSTSAISLAVGRLRELGYIDDLAFAKRLARELDQRGDMGYWRQRQTLLQRGFSSSVIEAALSPVGEDVERERALALARRRSAPVTKAEVRRLAAYLQRRGFGERTIMWCLRQVAAEVDIDQQ
jgi:regulatory protein